MTKREKYRWEVRKLAKKTLSENNIKYTTAIMDGVTARTEVMFLNAIIKELNTNIKMANNLGIEDEQTKISRKMLQVSNDRLETVKSF